MELNPEVDLSVDIHNLTTEFRNLPGLLFRYYQYKAKIEAVRDNAKARLKETRAVVYKTIKSDVSVKHSENSMEAQIDSHPDVLKALMNLVKAEHDATTWAGAVDSMKAKKDCLIQLGSDRRKEIIGSN
jgi:RecB family endonuclease NucS